MSTAATRRASAQPARLERTDKRDALLRAAIDTFAARGSGYWVQPWPRLGRIVLVWSYLYASAMAVRYVLRMARRPDQRWFGGTIPIIFHVVLAIFQWTFARYQLVRV